MRANVVLPHKFAQFKTGARSKGFIPMFLLKLNNEHRFKFSNYSKLLKTDTLGFLSQNVNTIVLYN